MNALHYYVIGMLSATVLVGCVGGVRPYDGVVGFTPLPQQADQYRYVAERRKGEAFVVAQLRKGCAEQLGIAFEQVQLDQLQINHATRQISQNTQVPIGITFSGDNFQTDRQVVQGQDMDQRQIQVIEASARCTHAITSKATASKPHQ
ncbi:MAG: hypothetical protein VXW65_12715 [Pseudomonadota bacterium]|nr:hypothetical protein [Pseudomonadota bacterium]